VDVTKYCWQNCRWILIIEPTRCTNFFRFIFGIIVYMFRTLPLSIIRNFSLYTQQRYMSHRFADSLWAGSGWNWFHSDPAHKLSANPVWHIPLLCVQWKTPDDGQRKCRKDVEFYSKNKFEKLVHVVGFVVITYHDAPSPECQNCRWINVLTWCIYITLSYKNRSEVLSKGRYTPSVKLSDFTVWHHTWQEKLSKLLSFERH